MNLVRRYSLEAVLTNNTIQYEKYTRQQNLLKRLTSSRGSVNEQFVTEGKKSPRLTEDR